MVLNHLLRTDMDVPFKGDVPIWLPGVPP
jgi:hypothetical protein